MDLKRKSQSVCLFLSVLSFISRFLYDFSLATDMAEGGIYDDIQFINPEEEEDSPGEEEGEGHERGLGRGGGRRGPDIEWQEVRRFVNKEVWEVSQEHEELKNFNIKKPWETKYAGNEVWTCSCVP